MKTDLKAINELYINEYIPQLGEVAKITLEKDKLNVKLGFYQPTIEELICSKLAAHHPNVKISHQVESKKTQDDVSAIKGIRNIIAIASGKGGVGKSSISANIALALSQMGASVGLLDADIYGPSQPTMLGKHDRPVSEDGKTMFTVDAHGIQMNSIGLLVEQGNAMVWRGPMVTQALQQIINETRWQDIDYLIVDLPPGTGDTQLTLAQKIPVTGAVIVTTPQDISLIDAKRAFNMFEKVHIDNIGIIENMSGHVCTNCGHHEAIFGQGGGDSMAAEYKVKLLGKIPLNIEIRQSLDKGVPIVIDQPDSKVTEIFNDIATQIAIYVAKKERSYKSAFGKIVIENKG